MRESLNQVDITGIVSEVNIRDIEKDGKKYISGEVVIKVEEKGEVSNIPVGFISADTKKDGTPNKIYSSLQQLKNFNSIASAGEENATKVQVKGARFQENLFVPQGGTEVLSFARINSNFFTKVNATNFKSETRFRVTGSILQMINEEKSVDGEMEETGRLIVKAAVVGYNDRVDVIKFVVEEPEAITFIKGNWKENDTVLIGGRLRYTEETYEKVEEVGFGEADKKTYTRRTRELLIERGSAEPLDEEQSFTEGDIKAGLLKRKERMEDTKKRSEQPKPQQNVAKSSSDDFGF